MSNFNTVAIMQPTYLPWVGYFALMDRVDAFIYLDHVQFAKRSWQQRNRIKTGNGVQWLTVPVMSKSKRDQRIIDTLMDPSSRFEKKHVNAMTMAYKKAAYFQEISKVLFPVYEQGLENLAELNLALIDVVRELAGIDTPCFRSSEMECAGAKADLLTALCVEIGAERYLSPPGSKDYMDQSDAFEKAGIEVAYHHYEPVEYSQLYGEFEPYLCVADLLFNEGADSLDIIRRGVTE